MIIFDWDPKNTSQKLIKIFMNYKNIIITLVITFLIEHKSLKAALWC